MVSKLKIHYFITAIIIFYDSKENSTVNVEYHDKAKTFTNVIRNRKIIYKINYNRITLCSTREHAVV